MVLHCEFREIILYIVRMILERNPKHVRIIAMLLDTYRNPHVKGGEEKQRYSSFAFDMSITYKKKNPRVNICIGALLNDSAVNDVLPVNNAKCI